MDTLEALQAAHDYAGRVVAGILPVHLPRPTPCAQWTVRDVLNHVLGGLVMFDHAHRGRPVESHDAGDLVGDDPAEAFTGPIRQNLAFWRSPGAFDGEITLPLGRVPAPAAALVECVELTVHGWDAGQGAGLDIPIDAELAAVLLDFSQGFDLHPLRAEGTIGPEVACPEVAAPDRRLLSLLGRRPLP
jgi:uncharacterized protein (TIGR03086 family)